MNLQEYASHDALGLAELVQRKEVTPRELALLAQQALAVVNPQINAVVETYPDRIEALDEASLGHGPFRGVPTLIKDVFGHEKGRKMELGSRLCAGMVTEVESFLTQQMKAAGLNIIGRSAAPEFSMAPTTESLLHGNTSTPWRHGYSAGGSSGGAAAAVSAGVVPIAHGSDIGGSIRIPASWCGGVGLKPSRARVSIGPVTDEVGFGFSMNMVQTQTVRDCATALDCLSNPQVGDPFVIPKPADTYARLLGHSPQGLRIGLVLSGPQNAPVDPEVAQAVEATGRTLAAMGHHVEVATPQWGNQAENAAIQRLFFFGFANRVDLLSQKTGRAPGPDTLEPLMLAMYHWSKALSAADFFAALAAVNAIRRRVSAFWTQHDVWLSPTTAKVSEPWGRYALTRTDVSADELSSKLWGEAIDHTFIHNLMGTPAISLPLAMHSTGLPIGVQLAAPPAQDHVVLQLAAALEQAMPWRGRTPPIHAARGA